MPWTMACVRISETKILTKTLYDVYDGNREAVLQCHDPVCVAESLTWVHL